MAVEIQALLYNEKFLYYNFNRTMVVSSNEKSQFILNTQMNSKKEKK